MPTAFIVRGLPGSGKTTWIFNQFKDQLRSRELIHASADLFFSKSVAGERGYYFDPSKLPQAHAACQRCFIEALKNRKDVVLDNTCSERWEYDHYVMMAEVAGYHIEIIAMPLPVTMADAKILLARQTHDVPLDIFFRMWCRWEDDPRQKNLVLP